MTYSYALENTLRNETFEESDRWYSHARCAPCYTDNNVLSKFLEVIIPYEGECFIPVLKLSSTIWAIQNWFVSVSPMQPMKLSYPLFVGGTDTKRTADAIIQSINRCSSDLRLSNVKTAKGLDYYGGNGLIFDEHWNPLMLCGFIIELDRSQRNILVKNPICYVAPEVFTNNDLLSKAIIKKIIPFLSIYGVNTPHVFGFESNIILNSLRFNHVPVTIRDIDSYFKSPHVPVDIENLDSSIWEFLSNNIPDLV